MLLRPFCAGDVIRWNPVQGATKYVLKLNNGVIAEVDGNVNPPLYRINNNPQMEIGGEYNLQVEVIGGQRAGAVSSLNIKVLPDDSQETGTQARSRRRASEVRRMMNDNDRFPRSANEKDRRYLRAEICLDYEYYAQAVIELYPLREEELGSRWLRFAQFYLGTTQSLGCCYLPHDKREADTLFP